VGQVAGRKDGFAMPDTDIQDVKSAVRQLADALPDGATWDDVMYRVYVHQAIDAGRRDASEGRLVDVAEVRRQFGLVE
jgi:predicted transcriptional regulator